MEENKARVLENLSAKFLKDGATVLAKPIFQIRSQLIKCSIFPFVCKIAKFKPLFKKVYLLISLLPLVSEIIEKVKN